MKFLQARHYTKAGRTKADLVVIHTAEVGESLEAAEALQRICATQDRVASWHYAVDPTGWTQSVLEQDVAFAAPGANKNGIQIELCGRARQTPEEWQDPYSLYTLEKAAELTAQICQRWSIPILLADLSHPGARGITTHDAVSKAFKKSTHWDPGPHFPMEWFLQRCWYYDAEPTPTEPHARPA